MPSLQVRKRSGRLLLRLAGEEVDACELLSGLLDALYRSDSMVHVNAQVRYEDGRTGTFSADLKIRDAKTFPPAAAKRAA